MLIKKKSSFVLFPQKMSDKKKKRKKKWANINSKIINIIINSGFFSILFEEIRVDNF
jgi:hypothetical protein